MGDKDMKENAPDMNQFFFCFKFFFSRFLSIFSIFIFTRWDLLNDWWHMLEERSSSWDSGRGGLTHFWFQMFRHWTRRCCLSRMWFLDNVWVSKISEKGLLQVSSRTWLQTTKFPSDHYGIQTWYICNPHQTWLRTGPGFCFLLAVDNLSNML